MNKHTSSKEFEFDVKQFIDDLPKGSPKLEITPEFLDFLKELKHRTIEIPPDVLVKEDPTLNSKCLISESTKKSLEISEETKEVTGKVTGRGYPDDSSTSFTPETSTVIFSDGTGVSVGPSGNVIFL